MQKETGNVKFYNEGKGFGFIKRESGSDVFFHVTGINEQSMDPSDDAKVEFTVTDGKKGPQAIDVMVVN